ncbi:Peroxygenase 1 [Vermiconidia calcicola]|uniref:Peroxygenase 1 n=1 Tax=Vermiconidia calcicola TaxID=1690605 RepID=A0ACC3NF38_9PEZI|nr:Peroxygenase 1 [Vermiconidia calcicola]
MSSLPDPSQPRITAGTHVPEMMAMIKELAAYENALDQVQATEQSLVRTLTLAGSHGHTNPGYAKTLILRLPVKPNHPDDKPEAAAAMALYFYNYSTWRSKPGIYLEDLFVRPAYRQRGYGRMLLQELAREVVRIDGGRLEWSCLKDNTPSLDFYRSLGAKEMENWVQLRVDGRQLERLALGKTEALQTGARNEHTGQVLEVKDRPGEDTRWISGSY